MEEKKCVMVVEDDEALGGIISSMLDLLGFQTELANNAAKALDIIQNKPVDYYIIDLSLPDSNGIHLYKQIFSEKPEIKGKVAFTSGHEVTEELQSFMGKHQIQFLPKPFTVDHIRNIVKDWK
ncbi:MAG: hypothetical protein Kow0042_04960 [Calditrichia bacterium]